jgi:hypothetical protein
VSDHLYGSRTLVKVTKLRGVNGEQAPDPSVVPWRRPAPEESSQRA